MQGVEILTSTQVISTTTVNGTVFFISVVIVLGACVLIGVRDMLDIFDIIPYCIFGLIFGCLFGLFMGGVIFPEATNYETQYKVTISEEVSMTEFYNRYEVIDQDGKIFTVKEKDSEEN
jgi:hypothetical protein